MASKLPYLLAFSLYIGAFVLCAIGYGTGYWFVAKGNSRLFLRLGLWEACFNGYEHTSDYVGKAYYGCWWIFHKEYSYIRDWIMPSWFIACQTLMTFAIVTMFATMGLFPMAGKDSDNTRMLNITVFATLFTTLCIAITVIIFGVMIGEDRTWVPRPDIDKLGWSYGLVVVSGFMTAFSFISLSIYTLMRKWELLPREDEKVRMMPPMPRV
ncbi:hypothetical protein LSH36_45g09004 [Paralvinella palmiformis]|uniref:Uncharacterized protein n=1 Tax=Paralvinella palmiformis TaxID=53620 RepID=A0AAD9NDB2_9ANNE|nr:hypothetical protein LSH36_45g09004 [Paralvinella palmiformis]